MRTANTYYLIRWNISEQIVQQFIEEECLHLHGVLEDVDELVVVLDHGGNLLVTGRPILGAQHAVVRGDHVIVHVDHTALTLHDPLLIKGVGNAEIEYLKPIMFYILY